MKLKQNYQYKIKDFKANKLFSFIPAARKEVLVQSSKAEVD